MAPANITRADTIDNSTNAYTSVERKHIKCILYLRKKGFQQRSIEHNKLTFQILGKKVVIAWMSIGVRREAYDMMAIRLLGLLHCPKVVATAYTAVSCQEGGCGGGGGRWLFVVRLFAILVSK